MSFLTQKEAPSRLGKILKSDSQQSVASSNVSAMVKSEFWQSFARAGKTHYKAHPLFAVFVGSCSFCHERCGECVYQSCRLEPSFGRCCWALETNISEDSYAELKQGNHRDAAVVTCDVQRSLWSFTEGECNFVILQQSVMCSGIAS